MLDRAAKNSESGNSLAAAMVKATEPGAAHSFSRAELQANLAIFFLAGHETSAVSMASSLWYLARYPEIQEKVYAEIVSVVGKAESPTYDTQKELNYMTQVIYESNRLNPPAIGLQRLTTQETELGGRHFPKHTSVALQIDAIHMSEKEWPNPSEFNPDRFAPDVPRHGYAWETFGHGVRSCLGRNFSIVEQRVGLVKILQQYRVSLSLGSKTSLETNDAFGFVRVLSKVMLHRRECA